MMATSSDTVTLRGGLVVTVAAIELLLDLERRDCVIRRTSAGGLFVGPRERVTTDDAVRIRLYRDEVLALVDYCEKEHD